MRIAVAKETRDGETRVAMVPELVGKLTGLGYEVAVEPDAGMHALLADEEYVEAGAVHRRATRSASADVVLSVQPLAADASAGCSRGAATISFLPVNQEHSLVADLRDVGVDVVRDGAGAAHLARAVDGRAVLAGAGLRLPLRDRRGRDAAPLLPAQHDRGRHRPARRGRGPRCRRRRAAGDRDVQAARRGRQGLRRARRGRRGDPVDGRQVHRPRAGHPRGCRRLRAGDDRGPGAAADGAAGAVHRRGRRADHHRRGARSHGAAAGHRRDGRADEAGLRGRRPGRRDRRQRRGLGGRRGRPDRQRAGVGRQERARRRCPDRRPSSMRRTSSTSSR